MKAMEPPGRAAGAAATAGRAGPGRASGRRGERAGRGRSRAGEPGPPPFVRPERRGKAAQREGRENAVSRLRGFRALARAAVLLRPFGASAAHTEGSSRCITL